MQLNERIKRVQDKIAAAAKAAIRAELTAIQEGRITPEEVELAKLSLQNAYRQMGDSQSSLEVFALNRLLNGTPDTPEEQQRLENEYNDVFFE